MRALVVASDGEFGAVVTNVLASRGHEVFRCTNAESARSACAREVPALIVLEQQLQDADGLQFCREVHSAVTGQRSVIVVITAHSEPQKLAEVLRAGADDYITRPIDATSLGLRLTVAEGRVAARAERVRVEEELQRSEERYRGLFENANDIIYTHDLEGNFTAINRAGVELSGYTREEILTMNMSHVLAPECVDRARHAIETKLIQAVPTRYELEIIAKDGHRIPIEVSTRLMYEEDRPVAVQGVARDMSERKRYEESLSRLAAIVESSDDAIMGTDPDGIIQSWNPGAERLYGYGAGEAIGRPIGIVVPTERPDEFITIMDRIRHGERVEHFETVRVRKDGQKFDVSLTISPIHDATGKIVGVSTIARDITERKRAQAALAHQALYDALTDLPNRTLLLERLQQAILTAQRQSGSLAVFVMDLDRFKQVNDTFGHHWGDVVLQQTGLRLRAVLRAMDTAARLGGDEFAVLLAGARAEGALFVARKLLRQLEQPFVVEDEYLVVGASIGIALYPEHGTDVESLLRRADAAMYTAKRSRDRCNVFRWE